MASPPAWSIGSGKRSNDWRGSAAPGPGAYNATASNRTSSPNWRIGSATRSEDRRSNAPGPGAYNSPGKMSTTSPKFTMGMKTSQSTDRYTPGPGAYDANGGRGYDVMAPSYSMAARTNNGGSKSFAPGPGAYDQTSRIQNNSSPNYRIGSAKRDGCGQTSATPGPGAYSTRPQSAYNAHSGPKHGFGSEQRGGLDNMSKTLPGPGQYSHRGDFDSPGKGTSLVPRRPDSAYLSGSRTPGPGAYAPSLTDKAKGPSYRIGSASRDGTSSGNRLGSPGPGAYNPAYTKGNKNVKIGTSTRSNLSASAYTPGPGAYDQRTKVGEGPKHIMNPRRDDVTKSKNDKYVPGPGAYSPSLNLTKSQNSTCKMGTSTRGDFYGSKSNPGPGQYDTRGNMKGPKWGFGSERRGNDLKSQTPGPGHYQHKHYVGDVAKYAYGSSPLKIHI